MRGQIAAQQYERDHSKQITNPSQQKLPSVMHLPLPPSATPMQHAALLLQACAHNRCFSSKCGRNASAGISSTGYNIHCLGSDGFSSAGFAVPKDIIAPLPPFSGYGSAYTPGHDGSAAATRWKNDMRGGLLKGHSHAKAGLFPNGKDGLQAFFPQPWSLPVR